MEAEVTENIPLHRFELPLGDGAMALAFYTIDDGRLVLTHTEVPAEFSGQGSAPGWRAALSNCCVNRAARRC